MRAALAKSRVLRVAALIGVLFVWAATPAFGAPKQSSGGTSSGSTLTLVLVNATDGVPHWGQQVTFNVSTTATSQPNVSLGCSQNGVVVYNAVAGFYPSYPWPWDQIFTLSSPSWSGGAASCKASLYYFSGRKTVTLTTLSFQVYA